MKPLLPLCALLVTLGSCTAAYKSGQTPDDVYFSPNRPQAEYVQADNKTDKYAPDEMVNEDRYLRMRVRNRRAWSDLDYYYNDPYAYNYSPYASGISVYRNNPWNSYNTWNYFYNPYSSFYSNFYNPYAPVYGGYRGSYNPYYSSYGSKNNYSAQQSVYSRPRQFNLNVYNPQPANNGRRYSGDNRNFQYNSPQSNNGVRRSDAGSSLRNAFNTNNNSSPARSVTPAPAPARSNTSTNAGVRRF